jgi:hypothetical protein
MGKCGKCNRSISRHDDYLSCSSTCKLDYHVNCCGIDDDELNMLKSAGKAKNWKCNWCASTSPTQNKVNPLGNSGSSGSRHQSSVQPDSADDFLKKLGVEIMDIVRSCVNKQMVVLKTEIDTLKDHNVLLQHEVKRLSSLLDGTSLKDEGKANVTYSQVLAQNKEPQNQQTFVIKPKNKNQDKSQTINDILSGVDILNQDFHFSKVKQIKDGGILVGCDSNDFKKIAVEKLSEKYDIHEPRKLLPRICIVGISDIIPEDSVISYITTKNPDIFDTNSVCKLLNFSALKKNDKVFRAVLQVDLMTYRKALSRSHLIVDLDTCKIFDAVELTRCYRCCGYGHTSRSCNNALACSKCGEKHNTKECQSEILRCINCTNLNSRQKGDIDTRHFVWESGKCVSYQELLTKAKRDVFGISA